MTDETGCVIGAEARCAHTSPHKLCLTHNRCVSECWAEWPSSVTSVGYGSAEHSAELSRRLARERLKTETLERTRDEWKKRAEGWETSATVRGAAAEALAEKLHASQEETCRQIKIKMTMSEGRERFLRALQGIASEPCASRLVSGNECDPKEFPCPRCKAKQAIKESERRES